MKKFQIFFFVLFGLLISCNNHKTGRNSVAVRLSQDPESLNPVNFNNQKGLQIINLLYQSLLSVDLADGRQKPLLAENLPKIQSAGGRSTIEYQIRESAVWDNQQPVTGFDVLFSLKLLNCPLVNNERVGPLYKFIEDVKINSLNPKEIQFFTESVNPEGEFLSGDFFILPAHVVDPKNLLKDFTLTDFREHSDSLANHPKIKAFAAWFNSEQFNRDKNFLKGSGGYELVDWKTGQYVSLQKKKNWWGDKLFAANSHITAQPGKITFQIIPDNATALLALQNEQLDVYQGLPVTAFQQLKADKAFTQNYNLYTPDTYDFTYLGINSRLPKFSDPKTRQALAHLLDTDKIIKNVQSGFAVRTVGPIIPSDQNLYNNQLQPYPYNLNRAKELLQEAGWVRRNNSWEKNIDGEWVPLSMNINYKSGNTEFENIALILQQAAAQVNIPVTIQPLEGLLLTNNLKEHNFEIFIRYLSGNPFAYNFKSILHTESAAEGGGNYTGFGTETSDKIVEQLVVTKDLKEKAALLKQFQAELHEQANLIFLYFSRDRLAVHNRFTNVKASAIKPGYDVSAFTLKAAK